MSSVFSKIIKGELPAYKIAEDAAHLAFLDIAPIKKGHCLVVPKKETDKIFDLSIDEFNSLMKFSYYVAKALEKAVPSKRIGMAVMGFEVPHAHVHLVPIDDELDLDFSGLRTSVNSEELKKLSLSIQETYKLVRKDFF